MTPRSGLSVALAGLLLAGLCLATLFFLRDWQDPGVNEAGDLMIFGMALGFMLLLDLGALLGLTAMAAGLAMATVGAMKKQPRQR